MIFLNKHCFYLPNMLKTIVKVGGVFLYYGFAQWLPEKNFQIKFIGRMSMKFRASICRLIFKKCGKNVNIQRRVHFGMGREIEIGNNSGIGMNSNIPPDTIIGKNVMIGPNLMILWQNHKFDRTDIPMIKQGMNERKQTIIEDDVWIGRNVIMTPGRHVKRGTIIGAGCVLTKDFPEYSIVGGNPSKLIRSRLTGNESVPQ